MQIFRNIFGVFVIIKPDGSYRKWWLRKRNSLLISEQGGSRRTPIFVESEHEILPRRKEEGTEERRGEEKRREGKGKEGKGKGEKREGNKKIGKDEKIRWKRQAGREKRKEEKREKAEKSRTSQIL